MVIIVYWLSTSITRAARDSGDLETYCTINHYINQERQIKTN